MAAYRLGTGLVDQLPVLALIGDREGPSRRPSSTRLVAGVGGTATAGFTVEDGAAAHCQANNIRLAAQVTFDWLDERLA